MVADRHDPKLESDNDIVATGAALKFVKRRKRELYGVPCPRCAEVRPKANPSILLPKQVCKVDGYRDPRPYLKEHEINAVWAEIGYSRVDSHAQEPKTEG